MTDRPDSSHALFNGKRRWITTMSEEPQKSSRIFVVDLLSLIPPISVVFALFFILNNGIPDGVGDSVGILIGGLLFMAKDVYKDQFERYREQKNQDSEESAGV